MKVLMVEPGKSPYETEIEGGLESLQAAVGGDIQATYPFDDLVGLICNDEEMCIRDSRGIRAAAMWRSLRHPLTPFPMPRCRN